MMTRKLFWEDPYQKEFDAKVLEINGNQVVLDQTCFYPMGGGQVGDTGEINGIKVVDTKKDEEEKIFHFLEREPDFKVGDVVHGKIDWERRHKIMRLHSAAHIVYNFMIQVYGDSCKPLTSGIVDENKDRLDYSFPQPIDREKLKIVEQKANEFIEMGSEVKWWTDEDGRRHWLTEGMPEMFCGGTHVKNTKEIGRIAVRRGSKPGAGKERIETILLA
jgi:Ser-tRNA(Ala) deacylase AlaX